MAERVGMMNSGCSVWVAQGLIKRDLFLFFIFTPSLVQCSVQSAMWGSCDHPIHPFIRDHPATFSCPFCFEVGRFCIYRLVYYRLPIGGWEKHWHILDCLTSEHLSVCDPDIVSPQTLCHPRHCATQPLICPLISKKYPFFYPVFELTCYRKSILLFIAGIKLW